MLKFVITLSVTIRTVRTVTLVITLILKHLVADVCRTVVVVTRFSV